MSTTSTTEPAIIALECKLGVDSPNRIASELIDLFMAALFPSSTSAHLYSQLNELSSRIFCSDKDDKEPSKQEQLLNHLFQWAIAHGYESKRIEELTMMLGSTPVTTSLVDDHRLSPGDEALLLMVMRWATAHGCDRKMIHSISESFHLPLS